VEYLAPLKNSHSKIALIFFVGALLVCGNTFSFEKNRHYSIPSQSLNNALVKFAIESDLELIFSSDMVRGLKSKALFGDMTDQVALEKMLQGSGCGCVFRFVDTNTVTIVAKKEPINSEQKTRIAKQIVVPARTEVLKPMTVLGTDAVFNNKPGNYWVTQSSSSTRTDTDIKQTPQSIQVLVRPIIDDQQSLSISESLKNISSIVTDHALITPSFDSTLIRGFKAEQLLDGFTQYYNPGDRESLVNIDRIEVIKGPNALLYSGGSGSPAGGLVSIVSKLPQSLAHYEVGMKYGSYQFYQPYFDLNQPITQNILFRLTGEYTNSDSHIETINTERFNINPALTIIDKETTFTLQGKVSSWQQADYQGLPAVGTIDGNFEIPVETFIGPKDMEPSHANFYGIWGTLEHSFNENWTMSLKARYTQSYFDQKVQAIFGADGAQADQPLILPSTWALVNTELFQQQEEVSFVANLIARFDWGIAENTLLLGADYSEIDDQGFFEFAPVLGEGVNLATPLFSAGYRRPGARKNNLFVKNITYGAYLQIQSSIYDRFHLVAGVRIGNVSIDYKNTVPVANFSSQSNKLKLLPRVGAVFDLTDELSVFFNYSEGMRGQSFANFNDEPKPELSSHLEAGIKFDIADQLTGQLAIYQIDRINVLVANNAVVPRMASLNGRQKSKGFETDFTWKINDSFNILVNYAYTKASFLHSQPSIDAGAKLPGVPQHSGRLWSNYQFTGAPFAGFSIGAGIYAQSGVYVSNAHLFKTESYYSLDASIAYRIENYKLGLSIKNLTDEHYFERIDYLGGSVAPSQGTSVFASISLRY